MIKFSEYNVIEESAEAGLAAKAEKSGISIGILRKVYRRGVAAWNSGHRPGTTPQQWGMVRVNSYITKGKGTYYGADKDLREEEILEDSRLKNDAYHKGLSDSTAKARVAHWKKMDKLSDRDPAAYKPAPGDATAKTKESKHTKKYRELFGEDMDEEIYEACWDSHKQVGMKKKGDKMVPNCVPKNEGYVSDAQRKAVWASRNEKKVKKEEVSADEQFDLIEEMVMDIAEQHNLDPELVWEKFEEVNDNELLEAAVDAKGHKSSTGGLTQKGRDYYNRKTGGNLQAPVTTPPSKLDPDSKAAKRRKSFCARMGGMPGPMKDDKGRPTRKAFALRKWNC